MGPGDEVVTTTHTFTATAEVVRYLGADVKLVDIAPATLNIDPAAVAAAVTPRNGPCLLVLDDPCKLIGPCSKCNDV